MKQTSVLIAIGLLISSCNKNTETIPHANTVEARSWSIDALSERANQQLDSTKWDLELFKQDVKTYNQYTEIFESYPLNKSPFPVAVYDYAVSSIPFIIENGGNLFKGVQIGEYENPESEKIINKLTLLVLTNDKDAEEVTLVDSRNYPYLTAQGIFKVTNNEFDWVFSASPDGFATLLINMKLFDLRFGETIIIYPQTDKSFLYDQIKDSPNNYENFEDFKASILNKTKVKMVDLTIKKTN